VQAALAIANLFRGSGPFKGTNIIEENSKGAIVSFPTVSPLASYGLYHTWKKTECDA
jgi:hypothetical protein